jgi:hypothetical protein
MKDVTFKNLNRDKAPGSQAQGTAFTFIASVAHPRPSPAEERPDLRRATAESLPPQFEQSLSNIARRI